MALSVFTLISVLSAVFHADVHRVGFSQALPLLRSLTPFVLSSFPSSIVSLPPPKLPSTPRLTNSSNLVSNFFFSLYLISSPFSYVGVNSRTLPMLCVCVCVWVGGWVGGWMCVGERESHKLDITFERHRRSIKEAKVSHLHLVHYTAQKWQIILFGPPVRGSKLKVL